MGGNTLLKAYAMIRELCWCFFFLSFASEGFLTPLLNKNKNNLGCHTWVTAVIYHSYFVLYAKQQIYPGFIYLC